jgi:NCAIR mutase (PurE)-related protein
MQSFEEMNFCKLDISREQRTGFPEIVFGLRKTVEQVTAIFSKLMDVHGRALVTRASQEMADQVMRLYPDASYDAVSGILQSGAKSVGKSLPGQVVVLTAGTSDIPVAEEAVLTAEWLGCQVQRIYDVGVAGIDRLLAHKEQIQQASVVIVVAGMEGALVSVVGGLVRRPVIAVPTSVGYGANLNGVTTMLAMMTACASGISVVNIDNGFGAGFQAATILQLVAEANA